jgi:branched-chain amino acid transport system substrate-binding protein
MKQLVRLCVAAGALMASAFAVSAQEEIKVGAIASLSGGGSAWGLGLVRGVELAIDEINAAGGLKLGDKTHKLRLVPFDDQYNAAQAKIAAERLVDQEKVKFIIGPIGSPGGLGSQPVTQPAKVLQFLDGYAPGILKNEWNGAYTFRVAITNREIAAAFVDWVKKTMPGVKKVGIIAPNDAVGQMATPFLVETYKKAGIDVWVDMYERGTKEFTPLLVRMLSQNVDLLDLNANPPGEAGLLLKQARQIGFKNRIVQSGGAGLEEIINIAGPAAEGFVKYDYFDESTETAKPFVAEYAKRYSGPMNSVVPIYYNAMMMLAEGIRRAGSLDTTKVRDAIAGMDGWDSRLFGKLVWSGKEDYGVRHQIMLPFYLKEVKGGKSSILTTINP